MLGVSPGVERCRRAERPRRRREPDVIADVEVSIARSSTRHPRGRSAGRRLAVGRSAAHRPPMPVTVRGAHLGRRVDVEDDLEPVLAEVLGEAVRPTRRP